MENETKSIHKLSVEEKRKKIESNYETINVLKSRLKDNEERQRVGMTRAAYMRMIFDVTKKVTKQNEEIGKAVLEVRRLQKDTNSLSGRLERCFKLVGETIRKDVKNDGWSRECYRLLGEMHANCNQLIQAIQDTGDMTRELSQLHKQIYMIQSVVEEN